MERIYLATYIRVGISPKISRLTFVFLSLQWIYITHKKESEIMNQFDNTPVGSMGTPPGPSGWFQTWIKAISQPNEQAYIEIVNSPEATSKTAFIWVFIAGTLVALVQAIVRTIALVTGLGGQMPAIPGLEEYLPAGGGVADPSSVGFALISGICGAPFAGLLVIIMFALVVAIVQWIAKLFGGTGSFEKLAYGFAASYVPITVVSTIFSFITIIPYVGLCGSVLSLLLGLYSLYLQITATKAVNGFGWGQAAGSVLIPGLVIFSLCCCLVFGLAMALGASFGQGFTP
jgi:hypothetical protein